MAPFVSQQLIQHLVTSNPSPAYIERVAKVFRNDGTGTAGNMKAVIYAILTDTEARAADNAGAPVNAGFGHMREPVLFMANILRGLNGTLGASSAIYNQADRNGPTALLFPQRIQLFLAAISHAKKACSVPNSRSIRPRPRPTAPISSIRFSTERSTKAPR